METNTGKYETAIMTLLPAEHWKWTRGHIALGYQARDIDELTNTIICDSRSMAKAFADFADETVRGHATSGRTFPRVTPPSKD